MYLTPLDSLVLQLKDDIFNHKRYRPLVNYEDEVIRHLLLPDIPKYIFNFVFDSQQEQISSTNEYTIDVYCQNKYGDSYAYPLVTYINGFTGIQDYIQGVQFFLPNQLIEFVNKYKDKYPDSYVEEPVEIPDELQESTSEFTQSTESYVDYLTQVFGSLFVEAQS